MASVRPSVRPSVSTLSFELTDLWPCTLACVWIATVAHRELKLKVIVQGQGSAWLVWPRSSIEDGLLVTYYKIACTRIPYIVRSTWTRIGLITVYSAVENRNIVFLSEIFVCWIVLWAIIIGALTVTQTPPPPLVEERSFVLSVSVCLSVCLYASISQEPQSELRRIFRASCHVSVLVSAASCSESSSSFVISY